MSESASHRFVGAARGRTAGGGGFLAHEVVVVEKLVAVVDEEV